MKIADLGEFGLIHRIQKVCSRKSPRTLIGIGDDAAALVVSSSALLLTTTDMLLEGVHFDLSYTDFTSLGWKSAAVNLSDIAAMGGIPRFCLISIGIPSSVTVDQVLDFYRGFNTALRPHATVLVGGDTCSSRSGVVITVTVLGEVKQRAMITRSGAQPGDRIFVTNTLGDSAAGLELLKAGKGVVTRGARVKKLIRKHLLPVARVKEGKAIARAGCANAMIDISDGLSSDLIHICEQSHVGAIVDIDKIPLSAALRKSADALKRSPIQYALSGGEDYELLLTVPPGKIKALHGLGITLTEIGEITRSRKRLIIDRHGEQKLLKSTGYKHF